MCSRKIQRKRKRKRKRKGKRKRKRKGKEKKKRKNRRKNQQKIKKRTKQKRKTKARKHSVKSDQARKTQAIHQGRRGKVPNQHIKQCCMMTTLRPLWTESAIICLANYNIQNRAGGVEANDRSAAHRAKDFGEPRTSSDYTSTST